MRKAKVFWFHYNKPATLQHKRVKISLHYDGICHIVNNIKIGVSTWGVIRSSSPKFIIKGRAKHITISNSGEAIIN